MRPSTKKTRRKTSGMTLLGLKKITTKIAKISKTLILRLPDKDINSLEDREETTRLDKELLEMLPTSSSMGMNQTLRGLLQIQKLRKCLKSMRMTRIYSGQFKLP